MKFKYRHLVTGVFGVVVAVGAAIATTTNSPATEPAATKPTVTAEPQVRADSGLVPVERFVGMLRSGVPSVLSTLKDIERQWNICYVPMMLEVARFLPPARRGLVLHTLETKTGQEFGTDFDRWMQWNWKQEYDPHPYYPKFKSELYSKIDPRFSEYFEETEGTTVRLDEVRWGGVRRDGIPPLKNPKMLSVKEATYLADTDVVFGIELGGDARCYPKRILAWHEMFKDTIGGESVCGVY